MLFRLSNIFHSNLREGILVMKDTWEDYSIIKDTEYKKEYPKSKNGYVKLMKK